MLLALRRTIELLGETPRSRWVLVLVLALGATVVEAVGAGLVFLLLAVLVDPQGEGVAARLEFVRDVGADPVLFIAVAVAGFFLFRGAFLIFQAYLQARIAETTGVDLSARLVQGYLTMPYEEYLQRNSSEFVRNAFESVHRFVVEGLYSFVRILSKGLIVVGLGVLLFLANANATLLAIAFLAPFFWLSLRAVHKRSEDMGLVAHETAVRSLQELQESLHGWRDVRLQGREAFFVGRYVEHRRVQARARYIHRTLLDVPRVVIETGVVLFIVAALGVLAATGGTLAEALPALGVFGYAAVRMMPEVAQVAAGFNSIRFVTPAIADLHDEVRQHGNSRPAPSAVSSSDAGVVLRDRIVLVDVSYSYPGVATPAIDGVSLSIAAGESVGFIGPTGGGKSTLLDLILGLLEPTQGEVRIDGRPLLTCRREWQSSVGMVSQVVYLRDDTIRRNIAFGVPDEEIDDAKVAEAVELAQLGEFLASLPDGLDTSVGDRGLRISGGQRQRLSIARALYRRPEVLVFDEGTSALDPATETALMEAVANVSVGRTVIAVAHRLTSLRRFDRIHAIDGGSLANSGSYSDLTVNELAPRVEGSS